MAKWIVLLLLVPAILPGGIALAQSYPEGGGTGNGAGSAMGDDQTSDDQSQSQQGQQNQGAPSGISPSSNGTPRPSTNQPGTFVDNPRAGGSSSSGEPRMIALPPSPPTEFQRLISISLGQSLPIFGAGLFGGVPSTFAPAGEIPVTSDYVIGPGDELRVHVWGQVNFNADVKVNPSGAIYLPQVGEIHVAGLHSSELDAHLRTALSRIFRNFDLSVELGQLRSIQILVLGQARRPGTYTISSLSTLVNALFVSGGPSPEGSMRQIQLKRGARTITTFDIYDLLVRGDKSKDVALMPGDVIFIPPVGPQVALAGSVRVPAIYELKGDTTLGDLIQLAGGRSPVASDSRISIESIGTRHSLEAMEVASDAAGMATLVHDGDLIRVLSLVPRFEKTVTIRGNLANPGNFAWHPGMRLSDLIPDKESLITRDYWLRRGKLGLPAPEFLPDARVDTSAATDQGAPGQLEAGRARNQAVPSQLEAGRGTLASAQQQVVTENTLTTSRLTDVAITSPEIDWAYAVIERLNANDLTTTLIPFNLGKLVLEHDPSQDLELQPGDVVTIFSQADIRVPLSQQTKFVRLEGEFLHSGIYSVLPGETLRQLVERVGGFGANAYLYGSEFTRISTRVLQQQRLDEYVQELETQIQRNQLALTAASNPTQGSQTATATAAELSQETLLTRLRQLRATGRIVLESHPNSTTVDSLPDLPLEDGDHFIVPPRPANINVVGAVYDQNSFLYSPTRRVGEYLRLAGGPNRESDSRRAFIIRADGSVLNRTSTHTLWGNDFDSARLYPGDTLVLPEKVFRLSPLRGLLDWSTLFSQFALGAAAIEVIQ